MDDKLALRISQAGMRFIAQMTIYNSSDFDRLRTFILESYHPDLLAQEAVDDRLTTFREQHETFGRMRVYQLIGTGKHHVVVLLEAQQADSFFLCELKIEEDYPHRVIEYGVSNVE